MEPEGSLPHSQEPATCPYPEPLSIIIIISSSSSSSTAYNTTFYEHV
jgi:hypothetical protein